MLVEHTPSVQIDLIARERSAVETTLATKQAHFGEIALSDVKVDRRFQRVMNDNAVKKIVAEYHPAGIGTLVVASINNERGHFIVDGQTRLTALLQLPNAPETISAEIFEGLSLSEAALLFRLRNSQKPIPPKDKDKIAVVEGDPIMSEVVRQAAVTNYVVFDDDAEKVTMPHLTEAKMIVRWGLEKGFPDLLARALLVQAKAFELSDGNLDGTLDPKILAATAELLLHNGHIIDDELIRVLSEAQLLALQAQIKRKADAEGTRIKSAAKTVIIDRYNKGKKAGERIKR